MRRQLAICIAIVLWGAGQAAADTSVLTNTMYIEDIAVDPADNDTVWVATRGGVEAYSLSARRRVRVYTTADGLPATHVRGVAVHDGTVEARTEGHVCRLAGHADGNGDGNRDGERFACEPAPALPAPAPSLAPVFHIARQGGRQGVRQGVRETARETVAGGALVGTAGQGLWLATGEAPVLLSPADQVCSNHVMAMAAHEGRLYLGSFDQGLCVFDGSGFRRLDTPFRMINDLASTPAGLYVAASEGLFLAGDPAGEGARFEQVAFVTERGVNGLAFDGRTLYVTSPATLWRIRVRRGPRTRAYWLPGGSRAVQKVAVGAGAVWLATEDKGVIRLARGRFQVLDRAAGLPTSWVMDVAAGADDTLYAATFRHGMLAIDMQGEAPRVRHIAGVPDDWMLHASVHQGALWVGTQGGAARVEDGRVATLVTGENRALPHPCVHAVIRFGGQVWLATEGGLLRLPL